jgi:hypothetical protein
MNSRMWTRCLLGVQLLCLTACGSDSVGRTVPVRGKVTVDGAPLKEGSVVYWPNANKGNQSPLEAVGQIKEDGTYELLTRGKPGARPGSYKVTVTAQHKLNPNDVYSKTKQLAPQMYTTKETTTLVIEVVESPGPTAYDLDLKK